MTEQSTISEKCPTCGSPWPDLHPAVQYEGEATICKDTFHRSTAQGREMLDRAEKASR
jgi:hypothetical protein